MPAKSWATQTVIAVPVASVVALLLAGAAQANPTAVALDDASTHCTGDGLSRIGTYLPAGLAEANPELGYQRFGSFRSDGAPYWNDNDPPRRVFPYRFVGTTHEPVEYCTAYDPDPDCPVPATEADVLRWVDELRLRFPDVPPPPGCALG